MAVLDKIQGIKLRMILIQLIFNRTASNSLGLLFYTVCARICYNKAIISIIIRREVMLWNRGTFFLKIRV